jgi:HEAT repeat protein
LGVRSVPWLRIGRLELTGQRSREAIGQLIERSQSPNGVSDHYHDLLRDGDLAQVLTMVGRHPESLAELLPIVANPEASINVRIGAGVVFEEYAGQPPMQALADRLGELTGHADARVRADACHYLGLTGAETAKAYLFDCLQDDDSEVREIAGESLEALNARLVGGGSS